MNSKKQFKTLTAFVIFSIAVVIIYSIAEFITSTITGIAHEQLTICIYGFFAGELFSCAFLKITKLKKGD